VKKTNGNRLSPQDTDTATGDGSERRRMGRIVHDDRGAASLEWRNAPDDYDRPVLRVEGSGVQSDDRLAIRNDDTFNPYDRTPDSSPSGIHSTSRSGKRDLRKLSEWLKLMRELEERKKKGEE
jgi:hypothetical protein